MSLKDYIYIYIYYIYKRYSVCMYVCMYIWHDCTLSHGSKTLHIIYEKLRGVTGHVIGGKLNSFEYTYDVTVTSCDRKYRHPIYQSKGN